MVEVYLGALATGPYRRRRRRRGRGRRGRRRRCSYIASLVFDYISPIYILRT
jgi:hypothetical protein